MYEERAGHEAQDPFLSMIIMYVLDDDRVQDSLLGTTDVRGNRYGPVRLCTVLYGLGATPSA